MRVLHVNHLDLQGRRFNGYDLLSALVAHGIEGKQAVLRKLSDDPDVIELLDTDGDDEVQYRIATVERRHSMNNLLCPWARVLAGTRAFKEADVVHYHLIHNQMISLLDLPWLFALRPSVWTFHDPWPMTGHCTHPLECEAWLSGCEECPALDRDFPLESDCANRMWRIKQSVFSEIDVDVVVASTYMRDMVRRSPLTSGFDRVHSIPFGIDTASFLPDSEKTASRKLLGIPADDFVVLFRANNWEYKGLRYILEALGSRPPDRPTTLLAVDQRGLVRSLTPAYNVIDLGWVDDPSRYAQVFSACDVLLMPSTAESFGLMALEAMAAGRAVVCFEGTAVPAITHAPECGIAVPAGDSSALRAAIDGLARQPEEAARRGLLGKMIATGSFGQERYLASLATLYRTVGARA